MPPAHAVLSADRDFATYARTHWPWLVVTARLLTDDPGAAEELVRRTLARMCAGWRRVPRDDRDFYVRRCLVRGHLRRLRGRRAARRRTVLVLRFWEELTDGETAQVLGCSAGAVRAHVRHGLRATGAEPGRLREVYARAAGDVVPSEVPLTDVQAQGRVLRRRRTAVIAAVCAALLAPGAFFAADRMGGDETSGDDAEGGAHAATSPVRIVTAGERVTAGPGVRVWLTADGGHWSGSAVLKGLGDSDRPRDEPGVSVRMDSVPDGFFLSGLYYGLDGEPGRVEVSTGDGGRSTAKVLVLAGSGDWGLWYASAPLPVKDMQAILSAEPDERIVTVYDASGKVAARSTSGWGRL
ncbi:sigma factor-like helix-turn-helix DNA-binding protein [Streptomyces sp. HD]|uniref:sigma factor-like helix-turn-helix DNA-binding protein n=1 Tax=Streptomyces sp. HD TaxID=3020892 RepID=UPI00232E4504|nr:sigma factor-like helix-turn-helix DNA-binding protein [Streptomyces sp. HD]MDC0769551.1 sigma factor-like helix-turn-helix DNA-binding protein [Streptomyces sp. HD]